MEKLFAEFKTTALKEWREQVLRDLKGEKFESLVWHNPEGFITEPMYAQENAPAKYLPAFSHTGWKTCIRSKYSREDEINKRLLTGLEQGADAVWLDGDAIQWESSLKDVRLDLIESNFNVRADALPGLIQFLEKSDKTSRVNIFHRDVSDAGDLGNRLAKIAHASLKDASATTVDVFDFHNQSCNASYETALALAALNEHFEIGIEDKDKRAHAHMGVNADFFNQLAKFRALHRLWLLFTRERKISGSLFITGETGITNKTVSDPHNNLLRSTLETMAAIAGGCSQVITNEFDVFSGKHSSLSERMSLNQQHILREESYFGAISDVGCGSWYIEKLTDLIAEKALKDFKRFEKEGGFFACRKKGLFDEEISKQSAAVIERLEKQQDIIVGVNKYRNTQNNAPPAQENLAALTKIKGALALQLDLGISAHEKTA
jgi:methylmalonyl-CoA mutase